MKKNFKKLILLIFSLFLIVSFLNACSIFKTKPPAEALKERVEGLMNAKIADDWGEYYTYLDSSYRNRVSKKDFMNMNRAMEFTKYTIESIDILESGEEATVKVKGNYNMMAFNFKDQVEIQKWIKERFNWYMRMK